MRTPDLSKQRVRIVTSRTIVVRHHVQRQCHAAFKLSDFDQKLVSDLKPFFGLQIGESFYARTGYTGEDGYEIMIPNESASALWNTLIDNGVSPIGLGARDTLRLEAEPRCNHRQ